MNKKQTTYITTILLILLGTLKAIAQPVLNDEAPEVKVLARATQNSIKLRWGVTTPLAWHYANQYGFIIKRKTITKNGQVLKDTQFETLTPVPILPKPMPAWEAFANRDDNAAVAVQALYGDDFNVQMNEGDSGVLAIVNQSKALEQRFSFALFAADQNYEVAEFSGLAYTDTTVTKGEQYLYRIYTAIPASKLEVGYGGVYLGLQDYQPLPKPLDLVGIFNDKSVMLSWNFVLQKRTYNNFIIERSEDKGNTFKALQDIPIVNLAETKKQTTDRIFYVDSLPSNNKEYQYRIKGISPFGELGPASDVVKGTGRKALQYNPALTEAKLTANETQVELFWEFPEEGLETIHHFRVQRANTVKGKYVTIQDNIDKSQRHLILGNLEGINYFTITAVGYQGEARTSFPKMVQLSDSTPPEVPKGLTGTVDSTGIVTLKWQKNVEADFLGYRVFKANVENEEYYQVTFEPLVAPVFIDTVNVKSLNTKVYYKVKAYDKRYNPSEFSETITLKKPDVVPPTQPVIKAFTATETGISLNWVASSSSDAVKTLVYRKAQGSESDWALVSEVPLPKISFTDTDLKPNTTYLYTLLTEDASGLESPPVKPIAITAPRLKALPIARFTAIANPEARRIDLQWKSQQAIEEYTLYKAKADTPLTVYKVLDANVTRFADVQLQINTVYTYAIQGLLPNGTKTPLKTIKVEY